MKSRRSSAALALAALSLGLAACGSNSTADNLPSCAEVWVDGKTLPGDYGGCGNDDSITAAVTINCKDGSKFTTYEDRFFAILGGTVHANVGEPGTDPAYVAAYDACVG
jgi:hypothetical protein